jgi:hypothetical protein
MSQVESDRRAVLGFMDGLADEKRRKSIKALSDALEFAVSNPHDKDAERLIRAIRAIVRHDLP